MGSKTPFSLRFEPELLKEVRAVSVQVGLPVTKIIELAVQEYMKKSPRSLKAKNNE